MTLVYADYALQSVLPFLAVGAGVLKRPTYFFTSLSQSMASFSTSLAKITSLVFLFFALSCFISHYKQNYSYSRIFVNALSTGQPQPSTSRTIVPAPARLKQLLQKYESSSSGLPLLMPCVYDGLTARLVARAGFEATFMTGFGVSAVHGFPDAQVPRSSGHMNPPCRVSKFIFQ